MGDPSGAAVVSVVIVAFHRPGLLNQNIPRLVEAGFEVVVVNVEGDPEVRVVAAAAGASHLPICGNPGFGASLNRGICVATRQVVVCMNDDVVVMPKAVLELARRPTAAGRDEPVVVVPMVVDSAWEPEPTIAALPSPFAILVEWALAPDVVPAWLGRMVPLQKWRRPEEAERVSAASAVAIACQRNILLDLPMPEAYFLYWEESEWFWRLAECGVPVWFEPAACFQHLGGRSDLRPEKAVLLARNAVRCVRRTQGQVAAGAAWGAVVLWNVRLLVIALLRASRPTRSRSIVLAVRWAGTRSALASVREIWG